MKRLDERESGFGRGLPDLRSGEDDGETAEGADLVGAELGITHDQVDRPDVGIEFFGDHLCKGCLNAGSQLDLAGMEGDAAIGMNLQPGADVLEARWQRGLGVGRQGNAEADGERTARLKEGSALHAATSAAFRTAATIRMWALQRQRLPLSASRICASVGLGLLASSAALVITMPLVQ